MPSTYTVNLGIEKPATGEQSGTWGDTTNVNFDIIDQAINGVLSLTLASAGTSGSPNTLTIDNGATSDGRNKWIEFVDGGDLGANAYVQLGPNDAEKIVFFRNSLSGSRSVFVFQGTYNAANDFEIPAGYDVVLKFDGGGASATVTDVFQKLRVTELYTPTLGAGTADINDGTVEAVIGGTTPKAGTFTTLTANTNLTVNASTTVDGIIDDDTMAAASATKLSTSESIKAYVDSQVGTVDTLSEILANGNTSGPNNLIINNGQAITTNTVNETTAGSGVTVDSVLLKDDGINATNLEITNIKANDGTAAGSIANSTGAVTITSFISNSVDIGGGAIDNTTIGGTTPAAITGTTITGTSFVTTGDMTFGDNDKAIFGAGSDLRIYHDGSGSYIDDVGTGSLYIRGTNLVLASDTGETYMNGTANGAVTLRYDNSQKLATTSTGVDVTGDATVVGGNVSVTTGGAGTTSGIFFDGSRGMFYDTDLRGTYGLQFLSSPYPMTFVTSSDNMNWSVNNKSSYAMTLSTLGYLGIGLNAPGGNLHIQGAAGDSVRLYLTDGDATGVTNSLLINKSGLVSYVSDRQAGSSLSFGTADTERMRIDSIGRVGIGTTSPAASLHIERGSNEMLRLRNTTAGGGSGFITFYEAGGTRNAYIGNSSSINLNLNLLSETASGSIILGTNGTERMRIDSSGRVGIGTTAPDTLFTVNGQAIIGDLVAGSPNLANLLSGTPPQLIAGWSVPAITWTPAADTEAVFPRDGDMAITILASNTSNAQIKFADNDSETAGLIDYDHADNSLAIDVNGSEAMRIDSSGNVGIGTSSPDRLFEVDEASGDAYIRLRASDTGGGADTIFENLCADNAQNNYIYFGDLDDVNIGTIRYSHASDFMSFTVNASERMRIDSSGNVGIGTSSPLGLLQVQGQIRSNTTSATATIGLRTSLNDTAYTLVGDNLSSGLSELYSLINPVRVRSPDYIALQTGGTNERMRIDSSGNVGIGTTSPSEKVQISAAANSALLLGYSDGVGVGYRLRSNVTTTVDGGFNIEYNDGTDLYRVDHDGGSGFHAWYMGGTERMRIDSSGNVGIGTTSPIRTLDIQTASGDADARIYAQGTGSGDDAILYLGIAGTSATNRINFGDSGDADGGRIIYDHSGDYMSFTTAASEAMRIDSSGNVGIGATNPAVPLHIERNNTEMLRLHNKNAGGGSGYISFYETGGTRTGYIGNSTAANTNFHIYNQSAGGAVIISTNATERMRITSSGVVTVNEGSVVLNGSTISAVQVTVADDAVALLTFTNRRFGMLNVVEGADDDAFPATSELFLGYVDFGGNSTSQTAMIGANTVIDDTNTLTGTTGADGKFTIGTAGTSGTLYLENRRGGTRTYNITLL